MVYFLCDKVRFPKIQENPAAAIAATAILAGYPQIVKVGNDLRRKGVVIHTFF